MSLVFQSFWTFAGSVILFAMALDGLVEIIKAMRGNSKKEARND